jgi:hypothetical protein
MAKKISKFLLVFLLGISLSLCSEELLKLEIIQANISSAAIAQTLAPEAVAAQVYQQLADLPKENQYINLERQQADPNNTLVSRLVRYHQYVKNRPLDFRLDWKLTIADYLGVNEDIKDINYPGASTLSTNPLEGDRQIITKLSRQQRDRLVNLLVGINNPETATSPQPRSQPEQTPGKATPRQSQPTFTLPKPGDADLLK